MDNQTRLKQKAARHAVRFIESGMIIGLGTDLIIAERTGIRYLRRHNDQMVET